MWVLIALASADTLAGVCADTSADMHAGARGGTSPAQKDGARHTRHRSRNKHHGIHGCSIEPETVRDAAPIRISNRDNQICRLANQVLPCTPTRRSRVRAPQ